MTTIPQLDALSTREKIRFFCKQIIANKEMPSVEAISKLFKDHKQGSPSTQTINDERQKFIKEEFWPTYEALDCFKAIPEGMEALNTLYQDGFTKIVISAIDLSNTRFHEESQRFYAKELEQKSLLVERDAMLEQLRADIVQQQSAVERHLQRIECLQNDLAGKGLELDRAKTEITTLLSQLNAASQTQAAHEREINAIKENERTRLDKALAEERESTRRALVEVDALRQEIKRGEKKLHDRIEIERVANAKVIELQSSLLTSQSEIESLHRLGVEQKRVIGELRSKLQNPTPDQTVRPMQRKPLRPAKQTSLRKNTSVNRKE